MNKNEVCNLIYDTPVRLPCNRYMCESHVCDSNGTLKDKFTCFFCKSVHQVNAKGFGQNLHLKKQMTKQS